MMKTLWLFPLSGIALATVVAAVTPGLAPSTLLTGNASDGAAETTQPTDSGFPFVIPYEMPDGGVTDASDLNTPIGAQQRIVAKSGHFYDQTGKRVRFVGVNMAAGAAFPTRENAPIVARRLRHFGVNLVRLHHMDAHWSVPNLFYFEGNSYGKSIRKLDPRSLERLDFFVSELKNNGIYVDLNLHVSREWRTVDGFPDGDKAPDLGKVIAYSDAKAIEFQREFAREMLTRKNPYTNQRYADDPVVAVVELNNEDSLVGNGGTGLAPFYRAELQTEWNAFLKRRYGNTQKLLAAWNTGVKPLGSELLKNGRLESGDSSWVKEAQGASGMNFVVESVAGQTNAPEGRALHITSIKPDGTNWHLQLHQVGLTMTPGETYTLSFAARADKARPVGLGTRLHKAPWSMIGLDTTIGLDTRWKRYSYTFVVNDKAEPNSNRISFTLGDNDGDVYLADLSLRPGGGGISIEAGQSVEKGNVDLPGVSGNAPGRDYVAYLMEVEDKYAQGLKELIQKEVGSKALVSCSQASYGGIAGVWRESRMDWVDMHSYWQHPSFPGRAFDLNEYRIENKPMVRSEGAGTLDGLAMHRVAGMPFTVSEYDHPAPNEWAAEMIPTTFAYAAWQDWDGVFVFDYSPSREGKIMAFFDNAQHPAKVAFLPFAARLFRTGGLTPAQATMTLTVPSAQVATLKAQGTDYAFWPNTPGKDFRTTRAALRFDPKAEKRTVERTGNQTDTPGFKWEGDIVQVDAPAAKALIGFIGGKKAEVTGFRAEMDSSVRNFAAVTLVSRDNKPILQSGSLLLTVADKAENPGLEWNTERTFAKNSWSSGPVRAWSPTGTVTIRLGDPAAKSVTVWALGADGKRGKEIPATLTDGGKALTLRVSPDNQTLWYEIAVQRN